MRMNCIRRTAEIGDRNGRGLGAFYICAGCPAWRIGMTAPAISVQSTGAVSSSGHGIPTS